MSNEAKHAFGNSENLSEALENGSVDKFDILLLDGDTDPKIGWRGDSELGDDDAIAAFDKSFHNRGWMRGPHSYGNATSESGGTRGTSFANLNNTLRKVITTFETDGQTDVYFRVQQKMQSVNNEMNFDFIELCPSSVYNNEFYPEDRW
jgi:hypothetical protein